MTWAARYSATEEPEITIYRDGVVWRRLSIENAAYFIHRPFAVIYGDAPADIAARVPVRECEETQACTRHAMPDGRCREHGGRDEL